MSSSFWPLGDTIDRKHLGCCRGGDGNSGCGELEAGKGAEGL